MKSARLFVGGLGDGVDKHMLAAKLSDYGSVSDVEIKEKKDTEGNVIIRFAYVNIEAPMEQLEQCARVLSGTPWQGCYLKIEFAKESFMDRLKRERAKTQNEQLENDGIEKQPAKIKHKSTKKNKAEEEMMASFKTFSSVWADSDSDEEDGMILQNNKKMMKLNNSFSKAQEEDEMVRDKSSKVNVMSSLPEKRKNASQIPDERHIYGSTIKTSSFDKVDNDPPFKTMRRYDPTLQEHQQFTLLSSTQEEKAEDEELPEKKKKEEGTVESSCFSLLAMFNKVQAQDALAQNGQKNEPAQKSCSFFLGPYDKRLQDGIDWMRQNDKDKILPEFEAVENDLYDIIRVRSKHARRIMNDEIINDGIVKGKGKWNKFKNALVPVVEEQTYDHGWRLAEAIQNDKGHGFNDQNRRGHTSYVSHRGNQRRHYHDGGQEERENSMYRKGNRGNHNQRRDGRGFHTGRDWGGMEGNSNRWGAETGSIDSLNQQGGLSHGWGRGRGRSHGRGQGGADSFHKNKGDNHEWRYGRGDTQSSRD